MNWRKIVRKLFCLFGIHFPFRHSRFHSFHCFECGKPCGEAVTYDNGCNPPEYTGLYYKASDPDKLYRIIDGKKVYE